MKFFKSILLSALLSTLMIFTAACSSDEVSAEDVLKTYYGSIEKGEYQKAYECLSKDIKSELTYEIFSEYYRTVAKKSTFKGYAPGNAKDIEDVKKAGKVRYEKAVAIPVQEVFVQVESGEEKKISIERLLAREEGSYKLIWENDMKKFLSEYYVGLANKAITSEKPDFEKAQANIDLAMEKDGNNPSVHYYMAILSNQKGEYDDAFSSVEKCISLQEAELQKIQTAMAQKPSKALSDRKNSLVESISYAYNIKGIILGKQGDAQNAMSSFQIALEYYEGNQYARMNISRIKPAGGQ